MGTERSAGLDGGFWGGWLELRLEGTEASGGGGGGETDPGGARGPEEGL